MDHADLQDKYGGQFVASKDDTVMAAGKTHGDVVRKLEELGIRFTEVTFEFIHRKDQVYIYYAF